MALFGLSGKKGAQPKPERTPVEDILRLRQQGLNNNQIIQTLQRNGYKIHQIFDAMNQAELKLAGPQQQGIQEPPQELPPEQEMLPEGLEPLPEQEPMQQEQFEQPYPQYEQPAAAADAQVEELVEAIIDEKWKEIEKDIRKIVEWKGAVETRMKEIEQKLDGLTGKFEELHTAVLTKVSEYDKNIVNVGTEIKAMEKVFKKVLPAFTENVNKLSKITKDVGKKK